VTAQITISSQKKKVFIPDKLFDTDLVVGAWFYSASQYHAFLTGFEARREPENSVVHTLEMILD
jgi:hypothetical protein